MDILTIDVGSGPNAGNGEAIRSAYVKANTNFAAIKAAFESGEGAGGGTAGADGRTILSGSTVPNGSVGADGDFYIRTTADDVMLYGPRAGGVWQNGRSLLGPDGEQGIQGIQGVAGRTVLTGTTAPGAGLGENGDFYIRTSDWTISGPKTSGAWPAAASLVGAAGKTILSGAAAPVPGTGTDGDFYIRTSDWTIYGPKAAGAWPAAVPIIPSTTPVWFLSADASVDYNHATMAGRLLLYAGSADIVVSIPDGVVWNGVDSVRIRVRQRGTGKVTISPKTGSAQFVRKSGVALGVTPVGFPQTIGPGSELTVSLVGTNSWEGAGPYVTPDDIQRLGLGSGGGGGTVSVVTAVRSITANGAPIAADFNVITRVEANSASGITFTIPKSTTLALPLNVPLEIMRVGTGPVTLAGATDVAIVGTDSFTIENRYKSIFIIQRVTDQWVASGSFT